MNRSELIKCLLNKSSLSVKDLSEKLNINRSNYYLWTSSRSIPKQSTINRLANILNLKVIWHDKNNGEIDNLKVTDSNYQNNNELIHFQRVEIQRLREENDRLKQNSVESILFSEQEYDWSTTVDIKVTLKGIQRRISDIENAGSLSRCLNTNVEQLLPYFDINTWHIMGEHPINKLITSQSLKNLEDKTKLFGEILKNFRNIGRFFSGDHYITIFVDYKFGENICRTICYCKIIESSKITILNKCKILSD